MVWPDPVQRLVHAAATLSRTRETDAAALFRALDRPKVWRHVADPPETPDAWRSIINAAPATGRQMWTVRTPDGTVVGTTSYLDIAPDDARLEIGWTLYTPSVWGTRVNPAAKFLLLAHAFETLRVGRVQLKTDVRNERSQQAISRLGARCEGILRRYQRRRDGTVRDTVLFSITAEDWPSVRDGLGARLVGDD